MPKGQMGFQPQKNLKGTSHPPKNQVNMIFAVKYNGRHKARLVITENTAKHTFKAPC